MSNKSEEITELAIALSKVQGEVLNATKDRAGYNYSYADLAQILDMTRPLLSKNGLSMVQMPITQSEGFIGIESMLLHSSGQWITSYYELPIEGAAKMSKAQACGSVITYMRRYALAAIVGIAQTDDDQATQQVKKAKAAIGEDDLKKAITDIKACTTMDELSEVFMNLDANIRTRVVHEKDEKKMELLR